MTLMMTTRMTQMMARMIRKVKTTPMTGGIWRALGSRTLLFSVSSARRCFCLSTHPRIHIPTLTHTYPDTHARSLEKWTQPQPQPQRRNVRPHPHDG